MRQRYYVCIHNDGYAVSLEERKIYVGIPDLDAKKLGLIRVIDESGDDYLYPRDHFASISLPMVIRQELKLAA